MVKKIFLLAAVLGVFLGCTEIPDELRNEANGGGVSSGTGVSSSSVVYGSSSSESASSSSVEASSLGSSSSGISLSGESSSSYDPSIPKPDAPTDVVTQVNSTGSISIGWGAVYGAAGYHIYRSTATVGPYVRVGSSEATLYTDEGLSDGTAYYYRVSGYNGGGEGSQSSYVQAVTQPVAPTGVTATASSTTSIAISWSSVKGAVGYRVYRRAASGDYELIGTSSIVSYTNSGLTAGTTYYYKVSAYTSYGSDGEGSKSDEVSAVTLPAVPTNVTAAVNSANSITISWSLVASATGYNIYRGTASSGDYALVGSSETDAYTDTDLAANTAYYYKVAAVNGGGEGSQSGYASATTMLATPTGVMATVNSTTSITVIWSSVTGAAGYRVYRSTDDESYTLVGTTNSTTTSYQNTGLTYNTTYYYKVAAYNGSRESSQSDAVSAIILPAPTYVTAMVTSANSISISWSAVTGASGYRVYRSTNNTSYTEVGSSSSTSYANTDLAAGTTYYYKVAAYNNSGAGSQSDVVYATTTTCNLSNPSTQYCSNGTVKTYGSTPEVGGRIYKTVVIGTQTWMAENLNYRTLNGTSRCYPTSGNTNPSDADNSNCTKYGRLYNWETAKTVCPTDWHLPSNEDWITLMKYVNPNCTGSINCAGVGTKLKTTSGWDINNGISGNGTDDYGFSALPGGYCFSDDSFTYVGIEGLWWGGSSSSPSLWHIDRKGDLGPVVGNIISSLFSVRCVKD